MITLTVNNKSLPVEADPKMPLLYALRDILGLTGTKFGCGGGHCGACTVHLNGQAIRSCITPLEAVVGQKITTIEGLDPEQNHPLQVAWRKNKVPQCGYCQSGQLMSAASLLAENANPNQQQITNAMQGNICRCGTYPRIKQAITEVAEQNIKEVS